MENKKEKNNKVIIEKGEGIMKNVVLRNEERKEVEIECRRLVYGKVETVKVLQKRRIVKRFANTKIRMNDKMTKFFVVYENGEIEAALTKREVVALRNMHYQICNGGIGQWRYNGYSVSDRQPLMRCLEKLNLEKLQNDVYGAGRSSYSAQWMSYWLYSDENFEDVEDLLNLIDTQVRENSDERIMSPNNSTTLDYIKGEF